MSESGNEGGSKAGNLAGPFAALVPEFYFDLISRILPGTILALGLLNACMPGIAMRLFGLWRPVGTGGSAYPGLIFSIAIFSVGYILGLLLSSLGPNARECEVLIAEAVLGQYPDKLKINIYNRYEISEYISEKMTGPLWTKLHRRMQDDLKEEMPTIAPLIAKMHAEERLFSNLMVAALLISGSTLLIRGLNGYLGLQPAANAEQRLYTSFIVVGMLVIAYFCQMGRNKRRKRYLDGLFSFADRFFRLKGAELLTPTAGDHD